MYPTMDEAGFASFPGWRPWWGIVVPAGTPDDIVRKSTLKSSRYSVARHCHFMKNNFSDVDVGSPKLRGLPEEDREARNIW